jgi:hypothetical protein
MEIMIGWSMNLNGLRRERFWFNSRVWGDWGNTRSPILDPVSPPRFETSIFRIYLGALLCTSLFAEIYRT